MIRTFKDKRTSTVHEGEFVKGLDGRIQQRAREGSLKGDRPGQYSIRINQQWRICFRWESGDAFDVEIVDYH